MHQAVLPVRSAYSVRSFPFWNKWQTTAFPFLPVFRLLTDALCLPHYSSFSQLVETTSSDAISHIWRARLIEPVFRGKCFDDAHLTPPLLCEKLMIWNLARCCNRRVRHLLVNADVCNLVVVRCLCYCSSASPHIADVVRISCTEDSS